jgi:two-component system, OmpR family, response regulator
VHRLRKKIEPSGVRIITVRGLGYCLEKAASPANVNAHAGESGGAPPPPAGPEPEPPSGPMPASHHFK